MSVLDTLSEEEIVSRLMFTLNLSGEAIYPEHLHLSSILKERPTPAAVLIGLLRVEGAWHILLTRRNADLPEHSGQVAFPGGRSDEGDPTPEATALREAYEEIGLLPGDVKLAGRLPAHLTITNYLVTPVVGFLPWPYAFHPEEAEVSRIFTIPLDWLAIPAHREERPRQLPAPFGALPVIYYQPFDGEILWGISARLTVQLVSALSANN